jgi:hypothetical protein
LKKKFQKEAKKKEKKKKKNKKRIPRISCSPVDNGLRVILCMRRAHVVVKCRFEEKVAGGLTYVDVGVDVV